MSTSTVCVGCGQEFEGSAGGDGDTHCPACVARGRDGDGLRRRVTAAPAGAVDAGRTPHVVRALQPTRVDLGRSAALGFVLTLVFYGVAVYPLRHLYFGQIFLERGWITKIEAFLAFWAVAFMLMKLVCLRHQRRWFDASLQVLAGTEHISQPGAERLILSLSERDPSQGRGFMAHRLRQVLACFCVRGDRREAADLLDALGDSDANGVGSSYTMLRVMIWAIPIVGFIGTVMGLGGAVGGFAGSLDRASDLSTLKTSLNGVTSGLSVAFDATFAALAISLIIMFPASLLEKAEMDLLAMTDDHCTRDILLRLEEPDVDREQQGEMLTSISGIAMQIAEERKEARISHEQLLAKTSGTEESVKQAVHQALAPHISILDEWRKSLAGVGEAIVRRIGEEWDRVQKTQQANEDRRQASLCAAFEGALKENREDLRGIVAELRAVDQHVEQLVSKVSTGMASDAEKMGVLVQNHAALVSQTSQKLTEALGRVEALIASEAQNAGAAWDRAASQQVGRINAALQTAQVDIRASQLALMQVADRFSSTLDQALATQASQFGRMLDTSSEHVARSHKLVAEDLHRVGAEWRQSLEQASRTLSDAVSAMAESVGKEQRQAVAELEVLMGRLKPLLAHQVRRSSGDGNPIAHESATADGTV